ncbi:MAG: CapA family protein [Verrucomicrobiota bacterium]
MNFLPLWFASACLAAGEGALPIHLADNHAASLGFFAEVLPLEAEHVLLLVDAHSDASAPRDLDELQVGLRRVQSREHRRERVRQWRREGRVEAFNWIAPLTPQPICEILWLVAEEESDEDAHKRRLEMERFAPGELRERFRAAAWEEVESGALETRAVAVSIDLDAFVELSAELAEIRLQKIWQQVLSLEGLAAVSFALSRPWQPDDATAWRLLGQALDLACSVRNSQIGWEPFGIEGPDRSRKAAEFYQQGLEPPRLQIEEAPAAVRSRLLSARERLQVLDHEDRWEALLEKWLIEQGEWRIEVKGLQYCLDGAWRGQGQDWSLRLTGGPLGRVEKVRWKQWVPERVTYNVLPELPVGKVFTGAAPPVISERARELPSGGLQLKGAQGVALLPDEHGLLRVSAEVKTDRGWERTPTVELRLGVKEGFLKGLSEQFGSPYIFGAGFLRYEDRTGPETLAGNDCANFLVYAWRRCGIPLPWCDPGQLRRFLEPLAKEQTLEDEPRFEARDEGRGLVIDLGNHVMAMWEDRGVLGAVDRSDMVVHHLNGFPEKVNLGAYLAEKGVAKFALYRLPESAAAARIAFGGDVMLRDGEQVDWEARLADLEQADYQILNLEGTLGPREEEGSYRFRLQEGLARELAAHGIDAVSLANNHLDDFGEAGLHSTLARLRDAGIAFFGAGVNLKEAVRPLRLEKGKVSLFAVSCLESELAAEEERAGLLLLPDHAHHLAEAIQKERRAGRAVLAMVHWGKDHGPELTLSQRKWAKWLVGQGVREVIGTGPHLPQATDFWRGVPIHFSLGNFAFPKMDGAEFVGRIEEVAVGRRFHNLRVE